MIVKSLLTAAALLIVYTLLIFGFQERIKHSGQTTLQRNIVKAEEYLYEASNRFDTVLVGSSVSERLIMDSIPGQCYNLAMAGLSSLDGLQLIKQSEHWPRLIYVELNTLDRGETSDVIQGFNHPRRQFLNRLFPFLRQKYQPVGVVKSILRDWQYGETQFVDHGAGTPLDTAFQEKAVQEKLQEMSYIPSDSTLQAHVQVAWKYVETFRQKGVKVIFFETPVDKRIQNHRLTCKTRQQLKKRFPASLYPTVCVPVDNYQTNDGVHLTSGENMRYTAYLRQQLNHLASNHLLTSSDSGL